MKKRGQIAVFIVLGIVILIISSFVFYTRVSLARQETSSSVKKINNAEIDAAPIEKYAEDCLKEVSDKGLWLVGEHGGYIDPEGNEAYGEDGIPPFLITNYTGKDVPYYMEYTSGAAFYYPSLSEIEKKLSRYTIVEFERCLDLIAFKGSGFYIIAPKINYTAIDFNFSSVPVDSNVTINMDSVVVQIEYPLTLRGQYSEAKLKDFRVNLPIRLGRLYNATVNNKNPEGVLKNITDGWGDDGTGRYDIKSLNCDNYDNQSKQINIYSKNNDNSDLDTKIVRLVDYAPFYYKYQKAYIFQFAIKKDPINFTSSDMCAGTELT